MGVSLVLPGGDARRSTNTRLKAGEIMFGSHKVKIEGELLEKVKQCSDAAGYESIDEFVIHMLEKETKKILPDESSTSKEEIQKRLRGLGYIE
ncbi:MAG TPA: hypothetical protein VKD23_22960 [Terriglobales bacterium]|nr:hypothetical protein [Terriglobales bacterium]